MKVEININVKEFSSFSNADKIKIFDQLYHMCSRDICTTVIEGRTPKDAEHCVWEALMDLMLGENVWEIWNKYNI